MLAQLNTAPTTMSPAENSSPMIMLSDPFILGTGEMGYCVNNADFTARADCSKVDCEQLRQTLSVAAVGGAHTNEPCARQSLFQPPGGVGSCSVYLAGEAIVGTFCFD